MGALQAMGAGDVMLEGFPRRVASGGRVIALLVSVGMLPLLFSATPEQPQLQIDRAAFAIVPVTSDAEPVLAGKSDARLPDSEVVELRYGLGKPAFSAVVHWSLGGSPRVLYRGPLTPAFDGFGKVPADNGRVGYSFKGEAGVHLFVLFVADQPIPAEAVRSLMEDGWFTTPPRSTLKKLGTMPVSTNVVRVQVTGPESM